jgi:hypothetical protein
MFQAINRDVLLIFLKQPFIEWVNTIYIDHQHDCPALFEHDQGNMYLIPEFDSPDEAIEYVKKNVKVFFKNELFD